MGLNVDSVEVSFVTAAGAYDVFPPPSWCRQFEEVMACRITSGREKQVPVAQRSDIMGEPFDIKRMTNSAGCN